MSDQAKDKATPRPWRTSTGYLITDGNILIANCMPIMEQMSSIKELEESQANARLIVKAVNCHDELVEALKYVKEYFTDRSTRIWPDSVMGKSKMANLVLQALSKVQGGDL